jgi:hypothetical protein
MSNDFSHKDATPTLFTWHDLRRTVATIMSTELQIPTEVISKLLDHLPPGVTEEVYIAQHYGAPTIEAMERWGEWLIIWEPSPFSDREPPDAEIVAPRA